MVCVIMASPERSLSFVIGVVLFINNMVLVVLSQVFGMITKNNDIGSYQNAIYAMLVLGGACVLTSIIILIMDGRKGGFLNMKENCEEVVEWKDRINSGLLNEEVDMESN